MEDVALIYHNKLGIAFRWKKNVTNADSRRVQMVFKDMGFYLLPEEIERFSQNIQKAKFYNCGNCNRHKSCRNILLRSPLEKMDFAVSALELEEISDLIEGTLFKLNLEDYLKGCGRN
ncbi:hypothetical protein LB467_11045 [Salegentibacter sp. JZCK2]|uniref:hypothetical protein n=1 Tax=Salegentibacter tibetensis TaxID=2873600 RepID=UPI001CCB4E39|nr:hypothetical protein [Salegentibacter tibetensis]MBZ9730223.1 hypothetical protein [Salegentibacter tibetensis]